MNKYRVKVRGQDIFLDIEIAHHVMESIYFDFVKYMDDIISQNNLPLYNTIIYEVHENGTVSCLGIDDGYEVDYNSSTSMT